MTTAIIDTHTKMIYADDQRTSFANVHKKRSIIGVQGELVGSIVDFDPVEKIRMNKTGHFVVGAGDVRTIRQFSNGFPDNLPDAPRISTTIVVCRMVGETLRVLRYNVKRGMFFRRWVVEILDTQQRYIVIGSGQDYAKGALAAGVTPVEAIKAASQWDHFTSANVSERKIVDIYAAPVQENTTAE